MADSTTPATTTSTGAPDGAEVPYELSQGKMFKDTLLFLTLLFAIFYFMLIRPQQKKFKAHTEMLKVLRKGDEVITNGGVIGKISKFEGDDIAVLEVSQGVNIKVARSAIQGLMKDDSKSRTANDN